eukprot:11459210-Ditylum_brightwellii.AAC.1
MRRFKILTKETPKESGVMNPCMIDELMALKEWHQILSANMDAILKSIEEIFTQALWDEFLLEREKVMHDTAEKRRQVKEKEEAEEAKPPTAAKTKQKQKMMGLMFPAKWKQKKLP